MTDDRLIDITVPY